MSSSTEKFVFKKEGSVRKETCDPADNVQVYRVTAAPGAYTAEHMENGHFFHFLGIQGSFVGFTVLSFLFLELLCGRGPDLRRQVEEDYCKPAIGGE